MGDCYESAILDLLEGRDLSYVRVRELFELIMGRELTDVQVAAVLVALRMKGETVEEIAGAASVMRSKSRRVVLDDVLKERIVDTCGTGGDLSGTFNVSTATAFVVASCGVSVAKHGNRSVSGRCGSADILESFGVNIELEPEQVARCIEKTGFGFMFAPKFHPAMASVAGVRKQLGIRTIFNVLGPLTNPADAKRYLMGVYSDALVEKIAGVLAELGVKKAFVVHGADGTDEVTVCGVTKIAQVSDGGVKVFTFDPAEYGMGLCSLEDIKGGDTVEENMDIMRRLLTGEDETAKMDMLVVNSAFALLAGDAVGNIEEGMDMARRCISEGKPYEKLCEVVKVSHEV